MAKVQIDVSIWDLIVEHYTTIKEPTESDERVMRYIIDKEYRRMAREDFLDARARHARMDDWMTRCDGQ